MNAPLVDWTVHQPFLPVDREVERLRTTCDVLRAEVVEQIQAKIELTRKYEAARVVGQKILEQAQVEHLACEKRNQLLGTCIKELSEQLQAIGVDGVTWKLLCNVNRALVSK